MPFDVRDFPGVPPADRAASQSNRRLVAGWLFCVAGMILVMVGLGGATRLTGSGLSIMEWKPFTGVLPPMNHADWEKLYHLYQQIPQYALVNHGFGLAGFKHIFWLEWTHRLWGRLIGLAFIGPLIWFWATSRVERRLRPWLLLLFILGGLQGAVGWFMVASGFQPDRTAVAPDRLEIHLLFALVLYVAVLWTGLSVLHPNGRHVSHGGVIRRLAVLCCGLTALTIIAGGIVAGTHAGFDYNTFPLMEGDIVPPGYARLTPFLRNLTDNLAAIQFDHRVLATLTAMAVACTLIVGFALRPPTAVRVPLLVLGIVVAAQYALGVATLVLVVPPALGVAHQVNAVLVLTAAILLLHAVRPPPLRVGRA